MAGPTGGGFFGRMAEKLNKAHEEHKGKPAEFDTGGQLPPGIENGVAQLVELKLDKYKTGDNAGKTFFYAAGVVVTPKEHLHNGSKVPTQGMRTKIGPEPLCDTPTAAGERKTFSDHFEWFRNQLLILGFDVDQITVTPGSTPEQAARQREAGIINGMAALKKQQPHFRFRTWRPNKVEVRKKANGKFHVVEVDPDTGAEKGPIRRGMAAGKEFPSETAAAAAMGVLKASLGKDPRTFEVWGGAVEFSENGEPTAEAVVQDNSGAPAEQAAPEPAAEAVPEATPTETVESTEGVSTEGEGMDLAALAAVADGADPAGITAEEEAAMNVIRQAATEAGMPDELIDAATSWKELVESIASGGAVEESVAEEWKPKVGDEYKYAALDTKTKKTTVVTGKVTVVDEATQTVTFIANKVIRKGVAWANLIRE